MKYPACLFLSLCLIAQASQPISPSKIIRPFESGDLSMFDTWLKESGHEDSDNVYDLKDGILHVKGHGFGYVATKQSYKDYHVKVEYKWGKKTDGGKYVRNSGLLLHGNGLHGASRGVWMSSLEVQLAQGCEGDFIVIRGKGGPKVDITCKTRIAEDKRTRWDPDGKHTRYSGRQFWWNNHQPFFKELLDTRGKDDVASPLGEWTKVECICKGDVVSVFVNGVKVNEAYNVFPQSGKILLQNESHEVFFRNFEIHPLAKSK